MQFPTQFQLRRRWPVLVLSAMAIAGAGVSALRVQALLQERLPGILRERIAAALKREVELGSVQVTPLGISVRDVRIPRIAGEREDPLVAKSLRVGVDWWLLLTTRKVRVTGVEAAEARVRLTAVPGATGGDPWTAQLVGLADSGIERLGVRNASIALLPRTGPATWSTEALTGELVLGTRQFYYEARANRFSSPEVRLTSLSVKGSGDAEGIAVKQAAAVYEGARLQARGTLQSAGNAALMTVKVERLPLGQLATRLAIPAEWAMQGSVTGEVTIDSRDNSLRRVRGKLNVARGSLTRDGGKLPWTSARAEVDWTPKQAQFTDVRIEGRGLTLTSHGTVTLEPGKPFTAGRLEATGNLTATTSAAVDQVAELLAFRKALDGRWNAGAAAIRFEASGLVGDLRNATARGHLHVDDLTFRPLPESEPVTVQRLDADLERTAEQLTLTGIDASTDGLKVTAGAMLTNTRDGGSEFAAAGSVDVADLKSLRRAVPQASLWRWVPVISQSASGRLEFRIGGPVGDAERLWSDGKFVVRDFRLGASSSLPSGAVFFIPVETASGEFRHAHRRLEVSNLLLDARTFDADGRLVIDFAAAEPTVNTTLKVRTDNWRHLPAMPPGALPEFQGGRLEGDLQVTGTIARFGQSEVTGSFTIRDARYETRGGEDGIPVDELSARFHWAAPEAEPERKLQLTDVTLVSPLLQATAHGQAFPVDGEYHLELEIEARTPAADQLTRHFTDEVPLVGGSAHAALKVSAPIKRLAAGNLKGTLRLADATFDRPIDLLGLQNLRADKLDLAFEADPGGWEVKHLALETSGLSATAEGSFTAEALSAQVRLRATQWQAPEAVPVTGGSLEVEGLLQGPTTLFSELTFHGEVRVTNARARYRSPALSVQGGTLNAVLRGEGAVSVPERWLRSGEAALTAAILQRVEGADLPLQHISADFTRDGDVYRIGTARISTAGASLEAQGQWSPQRHSLGFTVTAADLARLGIELPKSLRLDRYLVNGTVSGTPRQPMAEAAGTVTLRGVELAAGPVPLQLDTLSAGFHYDGEQLQVVKLSGAGPALTLTGEGEWSARKHSLRLTARGSDLAKAGVKLPEALGLGAFAVNATLAGTAAQPLASAGGSLHFEDAWFRFGEGAPHRLDHVAAAFELADGRIRLSGIEASGPAGQFTGTGSVADGEYRLSLASTAVNPNLVRWLLPGTMTGGKLAGTLQLAGSTAVGIPHLASGHFEFTDGEYAPPAALGLLGEPVSIARLAADYRWDQGRTTLEEIFLQTEHGTGAGSLVVREGAGRLSADLHATDAGAIADFWPVLNGRVRGGTGTGKLDLQFDATGIRGTLAVNAKDGVILLPGEMAEFAEHPVETSTGILGFEPGKLTFTDVKLRGPKANLDGSGAWTDNGAVYGSGKAWFSKSYTSELIKPTGFGWLARLFGIRTIESDFTVSGTSDEVNLKAGITSSLLWKLAKGRVPKEFQQIAAGKSPLWVKPLEEVADALPVSDGAERK